MISFLRALLLALSLAMPLRAAPPDEPPYINAVGLLYSQDQAGTMNMLCTLTAYEKNATGYRFISAAHCVGSDNVDKERSATSEKVFYMTFDEVSKITKKFHPAKVVWVGYQSRGEDLAVFQVDTTERWGTIPLGDEQTLTDGALIVNIASPLGLGLQTFHGTISKVVLDRPVTQGTINWRGTLVLQLPGVNGGSSGSAIISSEQKAIVGFLVGTIDSGTIIGIPVSRFKAVAQAVSDGKYKWWLNTIAVNPDGSPPVFTSKE
jgi:hypothetical protein